MTNPVQVQLIEISMAAGSEPRDAELNRIRKALPADWNSQYPVRVIPNYHYCCDSEPSLREHIQQAIKRFECADANEYCERFVRPASRWQTLAFQYVSRHFEARDHRVLVVETGRCEIFSGMERYVFRKRSDEVITVTQNSEHLHSSTLVAHLFLANQETVFRARIFQDPPELLRNW